MSMFLMVFSVVLLCYFWMVVCGVVLLSNLLLEEIVF